MQINALVLGKSGSGKSSLLNYLWGEEVSKVGVGRPVTPRADGEKNGIYEYDPVPMGGHELVIFDSWGLEADKAKEWLDVVALESERREKSDNLSDWFHLVIYCVGASGARIEDFEIEKVAKPLIEAGHAIAFVLTKSGLVSNDVRNSMRETILDACPTCVGVFEVESRSETLRGGRTTTVSGKEELLGALLNGMMSSVRSKLRVKYFAECQRACEEWRESVLALYDKHARLYKTTASTLKKVGSESEALLEAKFREIDMWRGQMNAQSRALYRAFSDVLMVRTKRQRRAFSPYSLKSEEIEWDGYDKFTCVVMSIVPLLNIGYFVYAKSMHRDMLRDKLNGIISAIMERSRAEQERLFV